MHIFMLCATVKFNFTHLQLILCLEGVRLCLEVYGRLCVSAESSPSLWLSKSQLTSVCHAWEKATYHMAGPHDDSSQEYKMVLGKVRM